MDLLFSLLRQLPTPDLRPKDVREFQEAVHAALLDGKLTEEEIKSLEEMRESFGLSEDALVAIRMELYRAALRTIKNKEGITEEDWQHMEQIQDYLGLDDDDVRTDKIALRRAFILSEITAGNLPIQDDVSYSEKEPVHWVEPVTIYEPTPAKTDPINLGKGHSIRMGDMDAGKVKGWKKIGPGELILTSRHIMVKGVNSSDVFTYRRLADAECFVSGVRLFVTRQQPMLLLYKEQGNQSIVGSLLAAFSRFEKE